MAFRERFGTGSVIPIRYTTVIPGFFTEDDRYGRLAFDPAKDLREQAEAIATILCKRIVEDKQSAREAEAAESIDSSTVEPVLPGIA